MQAFLSQAPNHPLPTPPLSAPDSARAKVANLLSRHHTVPCSRGALAFSDSTKSTSRFQLALDALLPILDYTTASELASRILVAFILFSLYVPHPITVNPFKSALYVTYLNERDKAVSIANDGGVSPNEQLVWVLWKILKGDGNDIAPYTPLTLARQPLPTKLRAINLVLDDELCNTIDLDDSTYVYFQDRHRHSASSDTNDNNKAPSRVISPVYSPERDLQNERLLHGMKLLLAARDRALNLSEQRALSPLLAEVAASRMVTSLDFGPIIANNPNIAQNFFLALVAAVNLDAIKAFMDVLPYLPPTLPTFDLMGRLLHDQQHRIAISGYSTIGAFVRGEVLGLFLHECIKYIERAERDQTRGVTSDDRFEKSLQHLCRFFMSLIKLRIVDPTAHIELCAEMTSFCLHYARFEEANVLYRFLIT